MTLQLIPLHQWNNGHRSPAPSADSHRFYDVPSLQTEICMEWISPAKLAFGWNFINEKQITLKHDNLPCMLDVIHPTSQYTRIHTLFPP